MNRREFDDLFENSTMTFGEHLEELRGALARSLIGLVLGFLIALPFADDAVRFVTSPLERALARVYLEQATRRLDADTAQNLTPEEWSLIQQERLVPRILRIDAGQLARELAHSLPQDTETQGWLSSLEIALSRSRSPRTTPVRSPAGSRAETPDGSTPRANRCGRC